MINTVAPALMAKAAARQMRSGGRIVNLSSTAAGGKAERTSYSASKAALEAMTRTWALELADRAILVNAIRPGPIDTPLFRRRNSVGSDRERAALAAIPLHRIADPDDIASLVEYLVSPQTRHITGQTIVVDGGATICAP
jgi:NAD(P)-dependent dehydrogenase (short-subunit alcohol dehydrogenase family)